MDLTNADLFCTYTDRTNIKSTVIKLKRIFLPCDFFTVPIPDSSFNYAFAPVRLYLQIIDIETTAEASDNRGDDRIIAWIVKWIFLDSIGVAIIIPI